MFNGLDQLYTSRAGVGKFLKIKFETFLSVFHVHGLVVTIQAARRITGGTCSSFVFFFYCSLLFRYCGFVVFLYTA